jgi:tetratricopeptide (TPR) repeat protein
VKLEPAYLVGCLNLAWALTETGGLEEAESLCLRCLEMNPDSEAAHNLLGSILERQGRLDKALAAYAAALEIDADHVESLINLGNLYFKLRQYPESCRSYLAAVKLEPHHPQVHNNLAVIFFYREEYQKAWDYLIKAEELGLTVHADFKKNLQVKMKKQAR